MSTLLASIISIAIIFVSAPFQLVVLVVILSLFSAISMSFLSTWLSLILVIMYVGGILVALAYFIALCPNQHTPIPFLIVIPFTILAIIENPNWISALTQRPEITDIYNNTNSSTLILLGALLFLAIVVVVNLVSRSAGPLRPLTNL